MSFILLLRRNTDVDHSRFWIWDLHTWSKCKHDWSLAPRETQSKATHLRDVPAFFGGEAVGARDDVLAVLLSTVGDLDALAEGQGARVQSVTSGWGKSLHAQRMSRVWLTL